jgi:hypothetical protein
MKSALSSSRMVGRSLELLRRSTAQRAILLKESLSGSSLKLNDGGKPIKYSEPRLPTTEETAVTLQKLAVQRAAWYIKKGHPNTREADLVRHILRGPVYGLKKGKHYRSWPYLFLVEWPMPDTDRNRKGDLVWVDLDKNLLVMEVKASNTKDGRSKCRQQAKAYAQLLEEYYPGANSISIATCCTKGTLEYLVGPGRHSWECQWKKVQQSEWPEL